MVFSAFFNRLEVRLQQALPGPAAQLKMAGTHRLQQLKQGSEPNSHTRRSAVLVLFYPVADQLHLPLILRPPYDGVHGGQVAFPGGKVEETDANATATALREASEEIGLEPAAIRIIGQLSELYIPPSNFLVQPVVAALGERPAFIPDPREVERVLEVPLSHLQDSRRTGFRELSIAGGLTVQTPYYDIEGLTVWGATAMMLSELLEVVAEV